MPDLLLTALIDIKGIHIPVSLPSVTTSSGTTSEEAIRKHFVDGVTCRESPIDVPVVSTVTVLEATAKSQEDLVDMALAPDEELSSNEQKVSAGDPYGAVLWPAPWTSYPVFIDTR
jgi:hypothetical protein